MASNPFDAFDPPAPKKQGNPFDVFDAPAEQPVVNQPVSQPVVQVEKAAPVAAAPSVADAFKVATPNDPQLLPPGQGVLLPQPAMRGIGGGQRQLGQSLNPQAETVGAFESLINSGLSSWYGKDMASAENNFFALLAEEAKLAEDVASFDPTKLPSQDSYQGFGGQGGISATWQPDPLKVLAAKQFALDDIRKRIVEARKEKDDMEKTMSGIEGRSARMQAFQAAANKEDIGGAADVLKGRYGANTAEVAANMALESAWPSAKGAMVDMGKAVASLFTAAPTLGAGPALIYGGGAAAQGGVAGRDAYVGNKAQNFKEWLQKNGVDPNDEDAVIALRNSNPAAYKAALSAADNQALAAGAAEGAVTGGFSLIPGSSSVRAVGRNKGVQWILKNGVPVAVEMLKEGAEEAVVSAASQGAAIAAGSDKPFSGKQIVFAGTGGALAGGMSDASLKAGGGVLKAGYQAARGQPAPAAPTSAAAPVAPVADAVDPAAVDPATAPAVDPTIALQEQLNAANEVLSAYGAEKAKAEFEVEAANAALKDDPENADKIEAARLAQATLDGKNAGFEAATDQVADITAQLEAAPAPTDAPAPAAAPVAPAAAVEPPSPAAKPLSPIQLASGNAAARADAPAAPTPPAPTAAAPAPTPTAAPAPAVAPAATPAPAAAPAPATPAAPAPTTPAAPAYAGGDPRQDPRFDDLRADVKTELRKLFARLGEQETALAGLKAKNYKTEQKEEQIRRTKAAIASKLGDATPAAPTAQAAPAPAPQAAPPPPVANTPPPAATTVTEGSYKPASSGNVLVMVDPKKLLDALAAANPQDDMRNPDNQLDRGGKPRVQAAKEFLLKPENQRGKLEASEVGVVDENNIGIRDGRHRILAAEQLGMSQVAVEVKEADAGRFAQFAPQAAPDTQTKPTPAPQATPAPAPQAAQPAPTPTPGVKPKSSFVAGLREDAAKLKGQQVSSAPTPPVLPSGATAVADPRNDRRFEALNRNLKQDVRVLHNNIINDQKQREKAIKEGRKTKNLDDRIAQNKEKIERILSGQPAAKPNAPVDPNVAPIDPTAPDEQYDYQDTPAAPAGEPAPTAEAAPAAEPTTAAEPAPANIDKNKQKEIDRAKKRLEKLIKKGEGDGKKAQKLRKQIAEATAGGSLAQAELDLDNEIDDLTAPGTYDVTSIFHGGYLVVRKMALMMARGVNDFPSVSKAITEQFGKIDRKLLKQLFDKAKSLVGKNTKDTLANIAAFNAAEAPKHEEGSKEISTRYPTSKNPAENPNTQKLTIDIESLNATEGLQEQTAEAVRSYPNMREVPGETAAETNERFIQQVVKTLLWIWNKVPPNIRARSKLWYVGANELAKGFAEKYDSSVESAAAVMAALSPQKDWFQNVALAEYVLMMYKDHQETAMNDEMIAKADSLTAKGKDGVVRKVFDKKTMDWIRSLSGTKYKDMDTEGKAVLTRLHSETYTDRSYHIITPEGNKARLARKKGKKGKEGDLKKYGWGSLDEVGKAIACLENPSLENISEQMGAQHKVRNFYNNIIAPFSKDGSITADTHAVAAALMRALAGTSQEVKDNFGSSGKDATMGVNGTYALYAEAYRRAAAEMGVLPREMQSVTWEAIRGMFPDTFKSQTYVEVTTEPAFEEDGTRSVDKNGNPAFVEIKHKIHVEYIDKIWQRYKDKKITFIQAIDQIYEYAKEYTDKNGGGIDKPDWLNDPAPDGSGVDTQADRSADDQGELSPDSVPGGSTGSVPGGTGSTTATRTANQRSGRDAGRGAVVTPEGDVANHRDADLAKRGFITQEATKMPAELAGAKLVINKNRDRLEIDENDPTFNKGRITLNGKTIAEFDYSKDNPDYEITGFTMLDWIKVNPKYRNLGLSKVIQAEIVERGKRDLNSPTTEYSATVTDPKNRPTRGMESLFGKENVQRDGVNYEEVDGRSPFRVKDPETGKWMIEQKDVSATIPNQYTPEQRKLMADIKAATKGDPATLGERIKELLDKWENDTLGKPGSRLLSIDPNSIAAYIYRLSKDAASLAMDFKDWSAKMVALHGPQIKQHLSEIWSKAKAIARGSYDFVSVRVLAARASKMWQNSGRYPASPTLKKLAGMVFSKSGPDAVASGLSLPKLIQTRTAAFSNAYASIIKMFAVEFANMDKDQQEKWDEDFRRAIIGLDPMPTGKLGQAVTAFRELMAELLAYQKASGQDIGDVGENYFPRIYSAIKIAADRAGFTAIAIEMHKARDARLLAADIAKLDAGVDAEAARKKELDLEANRRGSNRRIKPDAEYQQDARNDADDKIAALQAAHDAKDDAHYQKLAKDWVFRSEFGRLDEVTLENKGISEARSPDHADPRMFSQEEAAMADAFMDGDVDKIIHRYIAAAVKRSEIATAFGVDGTGFGQALLDLSEKENIPTEIVEHTADLVRGSVGVGTEVLDGKSARFIDWSNLAIVSSLLGLSFVNNLFLEPITYGIRTGSVIEGLRAVVITWANFAHEVGSDIASSRFILKKYGNKYEFAKAMDAALAENLGLMHNELDRVAHDATWNNGSDPEVKGAPFARWLTQRVLASNLMAASERAKVITSMVIAKHHIRNVINTMNGKSFLQKVFAGIPGGLRADASVKSMLNEMGVPEAEHADFNTFVTSLEGMTEEQYHNALNSDSRGAELYRLALQMTSNGLAISSDKSMKIEGSDSLVGRLAMQLQNYSYAYSSLIKDRMYDSALRAANPKAKIAALDRLRYAAPLVIGGTLGLAASYATKTLVAMIFPSDAGDEWLEEENELYKVLTSLSYMGMFGARIETVGRAVRNKSYGGPTIGAGINAASAAYKLATNSDSDSAARELAKQAEVIGVKPALVSGASAVNPAAGTAMNFFLRNRDVKESIIEGLSGVEKPKK